MRATISNRQRTTSLRTVIERAAGMHTAPAAGRTVLQCGACASEAHGRCKGDHTVGVRAYSCPCTHGIDAADWDAAYGPPWGVDVDEGE